MLNITFDYEDAMLHTRKEIVGNMKRFRLGDEVLIPGKLVDMNKKYIRATVWQICSHHVVFQMHIRKGVDIMRSLIHMDCIHVLIEKKSDFEVYSTETSLNDVLRAIEKK